MRSQKGVTYSAFRKIYCFLIVAIEQIIISKVGETLKENGKELRNRIVIEWGKTCGSKQPIAKQENNKSEEDTSRRLRKVREMKQDMTCAEKGKKIF